MHDPELNIYPRPLHGRKAIENARSWHFWSTLSCSQKPAFKSSTRILVVETYYHLYWLDSQCKWAFANYEPLFSEPIWIRNGPVSWKGRCCNECVLWCGLYRLMSRSHTCSLAFDVFLKTDSGTMFFNWTLKNALVFKMTFKVASVLFDGGSELWDALLLKSTNNVASGDAAIAASM